MTVTAQSGTHTVTAQSGTHTVTTQSGTHTVTAQSGTHTVTAQSGTHTVTCPCQVPILSLPSQVPIHVTSSLMVSPICHDQSGMTHLSLQRESCSAVTALYLILMYSLTPAHTLADHITVTTTVRYHLLTVTAPQVPTHRLCEGAGRRSTTERHTPTPSSSHPASRGLEDS